MFDCFLFFTNALVIPPNDLTTTTATTATTETTTKSIRICPAYFGTCQRDENSSSSLLHGPLFVSEWCFRRKKQWCVSDQTNHYHHHPRTAVSTNRQINDDHNNEVMVECVICLSKQAEVALIVCGHCCLCRKCAEAIVSDDGSLQCPICRKEASQKDLINIYFPFFVFISLPFDPQSFHLSCFSFPV